MNTKTAGIFGKPKYNHSRTSRATSVAKKITRNACLNLLARQSIQIKNIAAQNAEKDSKKSKHEYTPHSRKTENTESCRSKSKGDPKRHRRRGDYGEKKSRRSRHYHKSGHDKNHSSVQRYESLSGQTHRGRSLSPYGHESKVHTKSGTKDNEIDHLVSIAPSFDSMSVNPFSMSWSNDVYGVGHNPVLIDYGHGHGHNSPDSGINSYSPLDMASHAEELHRYLPTADQNLGRFSQERVHESRVDSNYTRSQSRCSPAEIDNDTNHVYRNHIDSPRKSPSSLRRNSRHLDTDISPSRRSRSRSPSHRRRSRRLSASPPKLTDFSQNLSHEQGRFSPGHNHLDAFRNPSPVHCHGDSREPLEWNSWNHENYNVSNLGNLEFPYEMMQDNFLHLHDISAFSGDNFYEENNFQCLGNRSPDRLLSNDHTSPIGLGMREFRSESMERWRCRRGRSQSLGRWERRPRSQSVDRLRIRNQKFGFSERTRHRRHRSHSLDRLSKLNNRRSRSLERSRNRVERPQSLDRLRKRSSHGSLDRSRNRGSKSQLEDTLKDNERPGSVGILGNRSESSKTLRRPRNTNHRSQVRNRPGNGRRLENSSNRSRNRVHSSNLRSTNNSRNQKSSCNKDSTSKNTSKTLGDQKSEGKESHVNNTDIKTVKEASGDKISLDHHNHSKNHESLGETCHGDVPPTEKQESPAKMDIISPKLSSNGVPGETVSQEICATDKHKTTSSEKVPAESKGNSDTDTTSDNLPTASQTTHSENHNDSGNIDIACKVVPKASTIIPKNNIVNKDSKNIVKIKVPPKPPVSLVGLSRAEKRKITAKRLKNKRRKKVKKLRARALRELKK